MVIVDTSVWIDYLRGVANPESDWLEQELPRQRLGIVDLILCEVLQGVRGDSAFVRVRDRLTKLHVVTTGGAQFALKAAENYRLLRQRGYTVRKTIDCWIATSCLLAGHSLLHRDQDFAAFEEVLGLRVIHVSTKR